jgi:hypothetical protein
MRIWPAYVAPAKNYFICVSIETEVPRLDRGGVQGVTPVRGIRMRERIYNFNVVSFYSILVSDGANAPYYTNDCLYRYTTRGRLKLETPLWSAAWNFTHAGQSGVREQIRVET